MAAQAAFASSLIAVRLKTEGRTNPTGIDAVQPRLSWQLAARPPTARGVTQTAYRVLVASSRAHLRRNQGDVWDSRHINSSAQVQALGIGANLEPESRYYWKVMVWDRNGRPSAWSAPASWYAGMLHASAWKAHWIAAGNDGPPLPPAREGVDLPERTPAPLPLFRRGFAIRKHVASALVAVSGLGQYELRINGLNVTTTVLNPGWTDYRKRIFYNLYDVTTLLKPGSNVLGVMLGNGMYDVPAVAGRYTKFTGSFGQPKLILQLTMRFDDGSSTIIASDHTWTTSPGPITFSTIYGGEDYDARKDMHGWDRAGFDARGWLSATEVSGPGGLLVAQPMQPVVVARTFHPVHTVRFSPDDVVYDLGMNFSGWPDIAVRGPRGSLLKLLPGELVDERGHVTQASNNAFPGHENSFGYTLKGVGLEAWHPQFSYNGFRYVEVTLQPAPGQKGTRHLPRMVALKGSFLHDGVSVDGRFTTSDLLFMKIHRLIDQAILSNMFSVLTDCPTREKLGWLEQTHLAATWIMDNFGVRNLYEKMADDMADSQLPSGLVPGIAPEFVAFVDRAGASTAFRDSPEWGSAAILSPFAAYRFYGDTRILAQHFATMEQYIAYLRSRSKEHILAYGLGDWYDIGPGEPGISQLTSTGLTATATYYEDLLAMAEICRILNNREDATYTAEAEQVKNAFNRAFFHPQDSAYDRDSQTANAMPLALGLVPADQRAAVLARLIEDIRQHHDHVTAGDIGFHYVVLALTQAGRSDVLADMLSRTDSPSYGYQIAHGATSLTEAWDGNPKNSQNHFMLGHAEEWFYRGLAGLEIDFSKLPSHRLSVHPTPVSAVRSAAAEVDTVYGIFASSWKQSRAGTQYTIRVPAGQTATITLRASRGARVAEGNRPIQAGHGIISVERTSKSVTCVVGSGTYHFFTASYPEI